MKVDLQLKTDGEYYHDSIVHLLLLKAKKDLPSPDASNGAPRADWLPPIM